MKTNEQRCAQTQLRTLILIIVLQEELLRRISEMDGENQELVLEISRLKEVRNKGFMASFIVDQVDLKLSSLREVEVRLRDRLVELEDSEERLRRRLEEEEERMENVVVDHKEMAKVDDAEDEGCVLREQVNSLKLQVSISGLSGAAYKLLC